MKKLKIGLCYDLAENHLPGPGEPQDKAAELDARETVMALLEAMTVLGHDVVAIGDGKDLLRFAVAGGRVDLVFNISEGLQGRSREAQVPALLEMLGIPYTGSDPLTLALCLDKAMFKRILRAEGVATPAFRVVSSALEARDLNFPLPAFVKPAAEGSGKGIREDSRVTTVESLREVALQTGSVYGFPVIVEEYLPGMEVTVGILGNGDARVIGCMEIEFLPSSDGFYSYRTKQNYLDLVKYHIPPRLPDERIAEIRQIALQTYHLTGCRDFGRVDLRLNAENHPSILEINPLAGLNPVSSDLVILAEAEGVSYHRLIDEIITASLNRIGMNGL